MPNIVLEGPMAVSSIYIGINALIMFMLAFQVTGLRNKGKGPGDDGFDNIQRAHGNNTEYVPMILLLLVALEFLGAPLELVNALGILLTLGRIMHGYGMSKSGGRTFGRFWGTVATWLSFLIGGLAVLFFALT